MVTMHILTYAVLNYIDILFVIDLFNIINDDICLHTCCTIYSVVLSLLNSKKAVQIQHFTDGATIVLRKHYHTGLNQIKYDFPSTSLSVEWTLKINPPQIWNN